MVIGIVKVITTVILLQVMTIQRFFCKLTTSLYWNNY